MRDVRKRNLLDNLQRGDLLAMVYLRGRHLRPCERNDHRRSNLHHVCKRHVLHDLQRGQLHQLVHLLGRNLR